jgi:hypothetical protein
MVTNLSDSTSRELLDLLKVPTLLRKAAAPSS